MILDIHCNGIKLGSMLSDDAEIFKASGGLQVLSNGHVYELEWDNASEFGYLRLSPEEVLRLGAKVRRVNKDVYIMAMFGDLLRTYHERFKRNAPMGLHEQLRYKAAAIVEDLW